MITESADNSIKLESIDNRVANESNSNKVRFNTDSEAGGSSYYDQFKSLDGSWKWPENEGFMASTINKNITLTVGSIVDRYGSDYGRYVSPRGTPLPERSLAPGGGAEPLRSYEVLKPLPVKSGESAPAFGQPGGGVQFLTSDSIRQLIEDGYLKEVNL